MSSENRLDRDEIREVIDGSFYHFVKIIGGSINQGGDISPIIHGPGCRFATDPDEKRNGILMPRIWRKSTVYTKWRPIYLYLKNPSRRQLLGSENAGLSSRFLTFIKRQLLQNRTLRWLYERELSQLTSSWILKKQKSGMKPRWGKYEIDLPRDEWYSEASMSAIGLATSAQSGHYDDLHLDDIIGEKARGSITIMETVLNWIDNMYDLLVEPDLEEEDASSITITGTHWAPGDAYCYIQEKHPEFNWLITPALKDTKLQDTFNIHWLQNPNVEHDECNYPEVFSTEYYREMRNNPEMSLRFWCEQQNNPSRAVTMTKFDENWLKTYHFEKRHDHLYVVCDLDNQAFLYDDLYCYGMVDPGGFLEKDVTKRSSRNAMMIAGRPKGSDRIFVIYTFARKFKMPKDFMDELFRVNKIYRPRVWRVEVNAQQEYILRDIIEAKRERNEVLSVLPIEALSVKDAKHKDIIALLKPMAAGNIYIDPAMKDFKTEVRVYPGGMTVDLLDLLGKIYREYFSAGQSDAVSRINEEKTNRWRNRIREIRGTL